MKYVILSDSDNVEPFVIPRQLLKFNGESLIERTIRLLKENGVKEIFVTSHDKRFDNLGATRYEPRFNNYNAKRHTGYWLSAFPTELLSEPITFLFGDCYYSENAIKTIVQTETKSILYFCSYQNKDYRYIKHHDEPFAFKVIDYIVFQEHIDRVKAMKDQGLCRREPIAWELYRSINGLDINKHIMTNNYVAINDESCDIDTPNDIIQLERILGGNKMVKCEVIERFTLGRFNELKNIERKSIDTKGELYVGDTFECSDDLAQYLTGENTLGKTVVKVIEVIPETLEAKVVEADKVEVKEIKPKTSKKKTSKK